MPGRTILLLLLCSAPVIAESRIRIPRVTRPPRLADFLESRPREAELAIGGFLQREPKDGEPASRATRAYLSHDEKHLYVVFVCVEDPARVRTHVARREALAGDDVVGVSLDTFHDGHRAYVFFMNPSGVQADGIATEGQRDDYKFDAIWTSEARSTAEGYLAMFTIPFHSLRFPKENGRTWGIALTRFIPSTNEVATWPRITSRIDSYIPQFATVEPFDDVTPGRNLQLVPYGFLAGQQFLDPGAQNLLQHSREIRAGVDAKVTFRNGLTLDATANPDFSQVESDEPQVTVNQRYEVFFPERRPFFQDNAGLFETPETLFFSRRIIDPQFGAKLTGKAGAWTIAALLMDDRAPGRGLPGGDPDAGRRALFGVARVQRDLGDGSSAGLLATVRQFGSRTNSVASADTRWKIDANWIFTGQLARSETREGEASRGGFAAFSEIRHAGRHFNYYTNYRWRTPDFETDAGYIPRVDIRQLKNTAGYRWWPEKGPLLDFGPALFTLVNYDNAGHLQDWSVNAPFYFDFKGPVSFSTDVSRSWELYRGSGLRKSYRSLYFNVERWKRVTFNGTVYTGTSANYYPAAGLAPFSGKSLDAFFEVSIRPGPRLRVDGSFVHTRLARERALVYTNCLARVKAAYQFSRGVSLRVIADYDSVIANPGLIDIDTPKRFRTDVLATWMLNPWTALHAGYADRRENLTLDDLALRTGRPSLLTGRLVFVKFSYLLRL